MAGCQGSVSKLILAPNVLFISVWVKTLAPAETGESCQQKGPLNPGTMAFQQPLWSQIPAVQTTQLPAPDLLGAAGGTSIHR